MQINDSSISKIHAYFEVDGAKHLVWDNDSSAGTQKNDEILEPGRLQPLQSGDRVTFGMIDLTFLPADDFYRLVRQLYID